MSSTILTLLKRAAQNNPAKGVLFVQGNSESLVTYSQLLHHTQQNAQSLRNAGLVRPGVTVVTYFDSHENNVVWFWSIVMAGGIPAVLPQLATESSARATQVANIKRLFGTPTILTSRHLADNFGSVPALYTVAIESLHPASEILNELNGVDDVEIGDHCSEDTAAILFTSGSSGPSKAVEYSHAQLIVSAKNKSSFHDTNYETNFMSWISFDHSASFCELHINALYSISNQIYVATSDLVPQPEQFFHLLNRYQVGYTFTPNSFLAAATKAFLRQDNTRDFRLDKLSVIMCGGEANRTSSIAAADKLLVSLGAKANIIKSSYGLSETCSACFYNTESPDYDLRNDYVFASVGKPLPQSVEMRLVSDDGKAQAQEVPGAVQLRGSSVLKQYYNDDAATKACMTPDGWFDTGDVGVVDPQGNLRIVGRSKEILIINGNNYSSVELENAIESSGVKGISPSYLATFSSWDEASGSESVVVLFHPTEQLDQDAVIAETINGINRAVISFCAKQPLAIIPLPKDQMPKSTIGKLSRSGLKKTFENGALEKYRKRPDTTTNSPNPQAESEEAARHPLSTMETEIGLIFSSFTNIPAATLHLPNALHRSGIDSIGYMRIKKILQDTFRFDKEIPLDTLLQSSSIHELEESLLSLGTVSRAYDPIVPLSVRGSQTPLFLIHGGDGEFLSFVLLKQGLPDRPVYALRAKGLHEGDGTFENLDDLLYTYYQSIKRIQPHGPYAILGYCFGGLAAFEIIKRLEAEGSTVSFAGGIDNPPELKTILGKVRHRALMIEMLPAMSSYTEEEAQEFGARTEHLSTDDFCTAIFEIMTPSFVKMMDLTVSRVQGYSRVEQSLRDMTATYKASGKVSKWDCFRAEPLPYLNVSDAEWRHECLGEWDAFCKSRVRYHDIDGNHFACVKKPAIERLQVVVRRALEGRGI